MAFNLLGFQFNRGITTANAQGGGFTAIAHTYKSDADLLAVITAPGYFPINFDGSLVTDKIFVHDWLFIVDSAGATAFVNITGVNPVTLGPDLFTVGGGFTVIAPIAPVDGNGIVISGSNVSLEFADGTHPGILSIATQQIKGEKYFQDIIHSNDLEPLLPTSMLFIGSNMDPLNTITLGSAIGANVSIPNALIINTIVSPAPGDTLTIHNTTDGLTIIGQDTASVTTGILTNRIDTISAGGHPLVIGASSINSIELGRAGTPVVVKGGVQWAVGGASIDAFNQHITGFNWTSPQGSVLGSVTLNKFDDIVYATFKAIPAAAAVANVAFSVTGVIPPAFRPAVDTLDVTQVVSNSAFATGSVSVAAATGNVSVFATDQQGLFPATGNAGIGGVHMSWSTI